MTDLYYEAAMARQRGFLREAEKQQMVEKALLGQPTLGTRLGEWLIKVGYRLQGQATIKPTQQLHNLK